MKIKSTRDLGGLIEGQAWPKVGEIRDLPNALAVSLLNDGYAVAVEVDESKPSETATAKAPATRGRPAKGK